MLFQHFLEDLQVVLGQLKDVLPPACPGSDLWSDLWSPLGPVFIKLWKVKFCT